jgi:hypothetical protein
VDGLLVTVVSAATSVVVALVGVWVARKKGLPGINAEIESRNGALIKVLEGTVNALQGEFDKCRGNLDRALRENDGLRRRVDLAEGDLLALYRERGMRPPRRLSQTEPTRDDD